MDLLSFNPVQSHSWQDLKSLRSVDRVNKKKVVLLWILMDALELWVDVGQLPLVHRDGVDGVLRR